MKKLFILVTLLSAVLLSCSRGKNQTAFFTADSAPVEAKQTSRRMNARVAASLADVETVEMEEAAFDQGALEDSIAVQTEGGSDQKANSLSERKLIKNGAVSLEVQSLVDAENSIKEWCALFSGYVESTYMDERAGNMSVRIPSKNFDQAMSSAGSLGVVKSKNVSSQDVSENFYDLQTRLETKKVMRGRLQKYLESAKDVKDMLQIERELNSVISDIESMEGRMKRLTGQIDYSQINVNFSLPFRASEDHPWTMPSFADGLRRFFATVVDFFIGFVKVFCYIVIFGIPIFAAIAFFYWLLFGKVGLVKKVLKALGGK